MMHSYIHEAVPQRHNGDLVLILVLMDDALVLPYLPTKLCPLPQVLILVLMDDALVLQNLGYALFKRIVRLVCAS